jgi:3-hydroxyacyl-CoA dehydrogenase
MSGKIGVVGAGLVGRGWAIAFARGGYSVALWDGVPTAVSDALSTIRARLDDLQQSGLVDDAEAVLDRITPAGTLEEAVDGAVYVQENLPETVETKREIFAQLDTLTPPETVLASSTSGIPASAFTAELAHRGGASWRIRRTRPTSSPSWSCAGRRGQTRRPWPAPRRS